MTSYAAILKLVWPLALGMVNSAAMQFVDRAYLAHHSLLALEAALPAGMLMWIFAGFFQSLVGYSSVFVGQFHGAGRDADCRATYRVAMFVALVSGVLSVPLVALGRTILAATTSSAELLADESAYFAITMLGGVAVYVQTAAASYFTGRGKTRLVFWVNVLGNVVNVALDPLLIFGGFGIPALGIAGAAYATVAAMAVQALVLAGAARQEHGRTASGASRPFVDRQLLARLLRFGTPSAFYTILNMLSFTIFVFVTEGVGPLQLAVSNACFSVNYLLFAPMEGFALGASTLVAQEIGRGNPDGATVAARRTLVLGLAVAALGAGAVLAFARPILGLFAVNAGADAEAFHALGFTLLGLMSAWLLFDAADIILAGALKGAGDTRFVMGLMLVVSFGLWIPSVFAVRHCANTMPALWATMIGYVAILCVGSWWRWRRGVWRKHRLLS